MNWELKSAIQRYCGALPVGSDAVYYRLQRSFGSLRNPQPPSDLLKAAVSLNEWLREAGFSVRGMRCFEVGTGRRVDIPFGLYLLGAESTFTCDLNTYLKTELVEFSLAWMRNNREAVENMFAPATDDAADMRHRLDRLLGAAGAAEAMRVAGVDYRSPADASRTGLPDDSIDLHYSYTVNEHIPPDVLEAILREAARILKPRGIALHHVDPSDHFAHDDESISSIHFLRFTKNEWKRHGDNQFAYHNRLRAHEHAAIFERSGFDIIRQHTRLDERALAQIRNGFPLADEFRHHTPEQLCGCVIRLMGHPRKAPPANR